MPTSTAPADIDLELLAALCRDFVADAVQPLVDEDPDRRVHEPLGPGQARALLAAADGIGLRGVGLPEADGGTPLDARSQARCMAELSRGDPGFAMLLARNWALTALIAGHASEEARAEWLTRYLETPDLVLTTSPAHLGKAVDDAVDPAQREASDADVPGLRAVLDAGTWILDERLDAIPAATAAGAFVLPATVAQPGGGHARGIAVVVPADAAGLEVSPAYAQVGQELESEADLVLAGVRVPETYALRGAGLPDGLRGYVRTTALLESAGALGVAQATFDAAARHLQERLQGGRLIVTYQAMAQLVARIATSLETIRALTDRAADAVEGDAGDATALALMARLHGAEAACDIGRWSMEVHGGSGVMREMGIERHYRDAVAFRNGVARDAQRFAIAKALLPAAPARYGGPESALDLLTAEHGGRADTRTTTEGGRDMELSAAQEAWRRKAREFAMEEIRPLTLERDAIGDPAETIDWELVRKGSKLGFRTLSLHREYGGEALDMVGQALVMMELARGDSAVAKTFSQNWKWSMLIEAACTPEQQERFLSEFAADDTYLLGWAGTEPGSGSDGVSRSTTRRPAGSPGRNATVTTGS